MALVACLWISKCCYQDWCIGLGTFLPRKGVGKHALGTLGKTESAYSDLIKFLWKDEQVHPHPVALTQWEHFPTASKISLRKSHIFRSVMSLGSRQKETWVTFYEFFFGGWLSSFSLQGFSQIAPIAYCHISATPPVSALLPVELLSWTPEPASCCLKVGPGSLRQQWSAETCLVLQVMIWKLCTWSGEFCSGY